jgi:hypothetical protein
MDTEVLPVDPAQPEPAQPAQPETVVVEKPRRRRWPIVVAIVLGVLLILGIVGFVVAEAIAKDYARDYVRDKIVAVFALPEDAEVDVELGPGSIILQALAGRVDQVDVDVPEVSFGTASGAVQLHAEGVPLDSEQPVDVLRVEFAAGADDLAALGQSAGSTAPNFEFADGEVTLSSEFNLFGSTIPIALSLEPSAAEGALVLTPTSVSIGGETFEAGASDDSIFGQLVSSLLQPQTLCIASNVPQALVLSDASIADAELVLTFDADGASFGGPELSTPGTCPSA